MRANDLIDLDNVCMVITDARKEQIFNRSLWTKI
jgi:hypothetical protein